MKTSLRSSGIRSSQSGTKTHFQTMRIPTTNFYQSRWTTFRQSVSASSKLGSIRATSLIHFFISITIVRSPHPILLTFWNHSLRSGLSLNNRVTGEKNSGGSTRAKKSVCVGSCFITLFASHPWSYFSWYGSFLRIMAPTCKTHLSHSLWWFRCFLYFGAYSLALSSTTSATE